MGSTGYCRGKAKTGKSGEDAACRYLIGKGHTIIERNWRCGHLEIDIISVDGDGIHFVEVKTRRIPMQASPESAVTAAKRKRITAAALGYLNSGKMEGIGNMECRFDVISVTINEGESEINYFPDAYIPIFV